MEDGEHRHEELPVGRAPFGEVDGILIFLGDPLAYGYDGEVWTFAGAHPLPGGVSGYCGIARPHRHEFAPDGAFRRNDDGSYAYIGAMRGGLAMVEPVRLSPPEPVIPAPPPLARGTFYFGGCLAELAPGVRGGSVVSALSGCTPSRFSARTPSGGGPATMVGDDSPGYFDGRYGRVRGRDARAPVRPRTPASN